MVRRSPKEVEPFLESVLKLASQAVVFDPNYEYVDDDDTQMDEDDGWGDDDVDLGATGQDDDDSSWKIRRASVKLIDAVITSRPDLLRKVYQTYARLLADRFKERDENVKCAVLETFRTLLKSAILSETNTGVEH